MLKIEPEISGLSIVVVGNLNPPIFTPDWFARYDLLPPAEISTANVEVIHPQIAQFSTDKLILQVQPERLSASTTHVPFVWLRDMIVRTFTECLPHTPLSKLGINREVHYAVESLEKRDQIGHVLAPPDAWGEWGSKIKSGDGLRHGGMISLTMQQRDLYDRPKGWIQATVQPSGRIPNDRGIYIQINDHYEVENEKKAVGSEEVIKLLEANFDRSVEHAEWIINQVMKIGV